MISCILCCGESLEERVERKNDENQPIIRELIQLYLPFYEIDSDFDNFSVCNECQSQLVQFNNFFSRIETVYCEKLETEAQEGKNDQKSSKIEEKLTENDLKTLNSTRLSAENQNYSNLSQVSSKTAEVSQQNVKTPSKSSQTFSRAYRRRTIEQQGPLSMLCDLCHHPFDSFTAAQSHYKSTHQKTGYLICCNRKFKQQSLLIDHLELHKNPAKFQCQICEKNLTSLANLKSHLEIHRSDNRLELVCDLCSRKFPNKYKMAAHLKNFHIKLDKKFECKNCGKKFISEIRCEKHERKHEIQEIFKCEICEKILKTLVSLKEHQKTHEPESDRIECELCGHFLKNRYSMRKHLNRHRQMTQNIKCEICEKPCTTKAALRSHLRMKHLLERTIPCGFCEKKFKQKIDKEEHESTHTGVDLYKCEFCGIGFKFGANFRAHRKHSHPEEYEKIKPKWLRPK